MKDQDYIFVADEAGISNDRWTVVGGICLHRNAIDDVLTTIKEYRDRENMHSELKWTKVSNRKVREYEQLVDYFFALNNTNRAHFHCIIFDSRQWNHKLYNDDDSDIGISKLYYQLLLHKFVKTCGPHGSLYARLDHRNSSTSLEDLRRMLNSAASKELGVEGDPLKQLVSANSKDCDLLQLNDVILGAVCAARNGKHLLPSTRAAKQQVAKRVLEKSALDTFDNSTPKQLARFTVWNMRPRPR